MKMLTFKKCLAVILALALQATLASAAITIDTQPQNVTAIDGSTVNFTVVASSDTGKTLTYQWFKEPETPLSGKTSNRLTITGVKSTDAGQYFVIISEIGTTPTVTETSAFASLVVNVRPVISSKPVSYVNPIMEGATATYDVGMNLLGTAPMTYTWQRKIGRNYEPLVSIVGTEGAPPVTIDNATASILTTHQARLELSNVQLEDAGTYRVQVTNITGTIVNSPDFSIKVNSRPVILTQPAEETNIALGSSKKLSVVVGGNNPMTFEWFKNGVAIPRSNSASITIQGTTETAPSLPDVYRVEISNSISPRTTDPETSNVIITKTVSENANVHVIRKPVIATHPLAPAGINIVEDPVNQTLSVTMAPTTNPGVYQYQWQKDGKNIADAVISTGPSPRTISGATTSELSFTPISWLDRGSYRVIVKNEVGTVTSKSTVIKVVSPPVILSQSPTAVFGNVGGSIKLFVVAGGTSPFKYEWFYRPAVEGAVFGTTPIAKTASLTLSKLTTARDGDYYCKVTNTNNGSIDSANIFLKVDNAPKITLQTSVVNPPPDGYTGSTRVIRGGSVRLQVAAEGTDSAENPMKYRWQKNKRDIVGAPSTPTLDLTAVELTDSGKYRCIVSNYSGATTSRELTIFIQNPPSITVEPQDVTQFEDAKLETIAVKATGAATLRFQWEKQIALPGAGIGWLPLTNQKSAKLIIGVADAFRDSGIYRCVVRNDVGTDISNEIDIIVNPIPVADLGPVDGVSEVDLYPTVARTGEYVRIYGEDLRFTKSVKFGTSSVTPVIESDNSILVKIPSGAPTTATPIEVVSKRGSALTNTAFRRTTGYENVFLNFTNYNNATIIPFKVGTRQFSGDNRFSAGLAESDPSGPVWYYLEVPVNHRISLQVTGYPNDGKTFDTSISLYEENLAGPALGPDGITPFPRVSTKFSSFIGLPTERVEIDVRSSNVNVKSKKYLVAVYGELFEFIRPTTPTGKFDMTVVTTKLSVPTQNTRSSAESDLSATVQKSDSVIDQDTVASEVLQSVNNDSLRLGGVDYNSSEPLVLSYKSDEAATTTTGTSLSFDVSLETSATAGDDSFAYQITDQNEDALLAVWISPMDGSIRLVQPDGTTVTSDQKIPLNADTVPCEIRVDPIASSWTVTINGVQAAEPMPLRLGARFSQASAVLDFGSDGIANGAAMIFSRFKVEHSIAP